MDCNCCRFVAERSGYFLDYKVYYCTEFNQDISNEHYCPSPYRISEDPRAVYTPLRIRRCQECIDTYGDYDIPEIIKKYALVLIFPKDKHYRTSTAQVLYPSLDAALAAFEENNLYRVADEVLTERDMIAAGCNIRDKILDHVTILDIARLTIGKETIYYGIQEIVDGN